MEKKTRVKECFKESEDDTVGSWYGGLVVARTSSSCLIAFDDGETSVHSSAMMQGLLDMGKLALLD